MAKSYYADQHEKANLRALKKAHKSCEMIWGIANCDINKRSPNHLRNDMACVARHIDKIDEVILDLLNSNGFYPLV